MAKITEEWPYLIETGIGEEREEIERRWEIYRWQQANMGGIDFRAGLEWVTARRRHEMCYRFKNETDAAMFKIVWGTKSSCATG